MLSVLYPWALAIAVVCSAATAFGIKGVLVGVILLAAAEYIGRARSALNLAERMTISVICCLLLFGMLIPNLEEGREGARLRTCENNMRNLAAALLAYHEEHGHYPPAYVTDQDGKPMHSWRVLLLPYIDRRDLYEQYDFNEPWNGPNNQQLFERCPSIYKCPSDHTACIDLPTTSYVAVVGSGTAWPGAVPAIKEDFADDGANTILLIECSASGINWREPRDLTGDDVRRGFGRGDGRIIACPHPFGAGWLHPMKMIAMTAFADGRVHYLPEDASPEVLGEMLSPRAEKAEYLDRIPARRAGARELVAFAAMIVFSVLFLCRPRHRLPIQSDM